MTRLSLETLEQLPENVQLPAYNPRGIGVGIVHLGIGAFHRGHQAIYNDDALALSGGDWGIVGVSLRSAGVRDRLEPQDSLYTYVERGADGENLRVIGSIIGTLVAPEDPEAVLSLMANASTRIVSMTITEKGYLRDSASGELMADHADIQHDLANPGTPRTMHGFVVEALARRHAAGTGPFTLLCCDNLPSNGVSLKQVVLGFARLRDAALAEWIEANVTFPCTMVDRIVPATTDEDIEKTAQALGLSDEAPVIGEPFIQWVVQDDFAAGRPAWEDVGVEMVLDVEPFEEMKLRLLNGSHSSLAYLGYLGGYDYIHQTMADENYATFVRALMDEEVTPTLDVPGGSDVEAYKDQLIARFRNPALHHRTWQIAMDGSQKLPQRLLNTVRSRIESGASYGHLALAVAAWMRYVTGINENGDAIEVSDPLAGELRSLADKHTGDVAAYVQAMLAVTEVFGEDLSDNAGFQDMVVKALESLYAQGAKATVAALNERSGS